MGLGWGCFACGSYGFIWVVLMGVRVGVVMGVGGGVVGVTRGWCGVFGGGVGVVRGGVLWGCGCGVCCWGVCFGRCDDVGDCGGWGDFGGLIGDELGMSNGGGIMIRMRIRIGGIRAVFYCGGGRD